MLNANDIHPAVEALQTGLDDSRNKWSDISSTVNIIIWSSWLWGCQSAQWDCPDACWSLPLSVCGSLMPSPWFFSAPVNKCVVNYVILTTHFSASMKTWHAHCTMLQLTRLCIWNKIISCYNSKILHTHIFLSLLLKSQLCFGFGPLWLLWCTAFSAGINRGLDHSF